MIFLLLKTHKKNKLGVFSKTIIWELQSQRIKVFNVLPKKKVFNVEDLATGFRGEVLFVSRGMIVFSQFIVNFGFGYNLSIVISILL